MYFNNCWPFQHAFNIFPSKNLTYLNKTPLVSSHCNTRHPFSRNIPPDEFQTELHDSLATFYEKILKKAGAGCRPVARTEALSRKLNTKSASVPETESLTDSVEAANGGQEVTLPTPPPAAAVAAAAAPPD